MSNKQGSKVSAEVWVIGLILVAAGGGSFLVQAVRFVFFGSHLGIVAGNFAVFGIILAILGAALMN